RTDINGTQITHELPPSPPPAHPDQPRRRRGVTGLVAVALAAGLIGGGGAAAITHQLASDNAAAPTAVGAPITNTKTAPTAVEQVAGRLLPSVVSIEER